MKTKYSANPAYHRLQLDLTPEEYKKLKRIADGEGRTATKQAKAMIRELLFPNTSVLIENKSRKQA